MHSEALNAFLVAVPLLLFLVAAVLRVDEHLFQSEKRRKGREHQRRFAITKEDGEMVFTDPDGRAFSAKRD